MNTAFIGSAGAQGPMIAQEEGMSAGKDDSHGPLFLGLDPGDAGPDQGNAGGSGPAVADNNSEGPALAAPREQPDEEFFQQAAPISPALDLSDIPDDQKALYRELLELKTVVERLREEAEAREHLRTKEDEERDTEEEILEAAGRQYSIRPPWTFSMDLNVNYSYNAYDIIRYLDMIEGRAPEYHSNHNLDNSLTLESGVRDNVAVSATVPFIYKYDKVDTAESRSVTGLGDMSIGIKYQPLKTGGAYPSPIFSLSYGIPTGKSPYEINPDRQLSTGSGLERLTGSVSVSQPVDPVSAFASLSYTHRYKETNIGQRRGSRTLQEVRPGGSVGASLGFGYAVSYRMSLSLSLSFSYAYATDYLWSVREGTEKTSSGDSVSASLGLTTAWRVTPSRSVIIGIGKGLTTANPGFSISTRIPVSFDWR